MSPAEIIELLSSCPQSCDDVEEMCFDMQGPSPPPPSPPPPETGCTNDNDYWEGGWTCDDWVGWPCRAGYPGIKTARLVAACPVACADVERMCAPPNPPPTPPSPPIEPSIYFWPPPPPPPETGICIADGIASHPAVLGASCGSAAVAMLLVLLALRKHSPMRGVVWPKATGWMTYFGMLLVPVVVFLSSTGLYAACYASPSLYVLLCMITLFDSVLFACAAFCDAGSIPRGGSGERASAHAVQFYEDVCNGSRSAKDMIRGIEVELKVCKTCRIIRPPRASHDRKTNRCVRKFDHFCPFTGNAVGERNYMWFLAFVTCTAASAVVFFCVCVWHVAHLSTREAHAEQLRVGPSAQVSDGFAFGKAIASGGMLSLLLAGYFALAASLTGALLGFHCYFVSTGLTTYEWLRGAWKGVDGNPFDLGVQRNWFNFFAGVDQRAGISIEWTPRSAELQNLDTDVASY